jgi:TP901 family phage tail tape measure protein
VPLGLREVLIVLRAKDQASRQIVGVGTALGALPAQGKLAAQNFTQLGTALTGVGIGIAGIGAVGLAFFNKATDAAIEYNRTVALTYTQVDKGKGSYKELYDIGLKIAHDFPVQFGQIQPVLYDIFSSMDVNTKEAQRLMQGFSVAAVGGQVDIQDAARATIAIMNAYKIPAKDVGKVLDWQFQLVRKGVGTYGEFASTIGRAIPSAARAGQNFQTLASMMAFMTRNGVSAAMAAASTGRALDAMSNSKVVGRLEKMGIKVKDMNGEFRPMVDVLGEVNAKFSKMTGPEKAKALEALFKGAGGTIQARRFFDMVFKNFDEFKQRSDEMKNSGGAALEAFSKMMDTPASRAQILSNRFKELQINIGQGLIPIKEKLIEVATRLIGWWNGLGKKTQDLIVKIALFAAAFAVVIGVVLTVMGLFAILIGAIMALGVTFGVAIGVIAGVVAALALIPVAAYLVIKYWDVIKEKAGIVWGYVAAAFKKVVGFLARVGVFKELAKIWEMLKTRALDTWKSIQKIVGVAIKVVGAAIRAGVEVIKFIWNNFGKYIFGVIKGTWTMIVATIKGAIRIVSDIIGGLADFLTGDWQSLWNRTKDIVGAVWDTIYGILRGAVGIVGSIVMGFVDVITWPFRKIYDILVGHSIIPDLITSIVNWFTGLPGKVVRALGNLLTLLVRKGKDLVTGLFNGIKNAFIAVLIWWGNLEITILKKIGNAVVWLLQKGKDIVTGLFNGIKDIALTVWSWFRDLPGKLKDFFVNAINWLIGAGKTIFSGLWNGMKEIVLTIWSWMHSLPGKIKDFFLNAGHWLWDIGKKIISGLWDGMKSAWGSVTDWLGGLGGIITSIKGPPAKDARLLTNNGRLIMKGFHRGLQEGWSGVEAYLGAMTSGISTKFSTQMQPSFTGGAMKQNLFAAGAIRIEINGTDMSKEEIADAVAEKLAQALEVRA